MRRYRNVEVIKTYLVTPKMRRIYFAGAELADFKLLRPGQWVMLKLIDDHRSINESRAYTIRRYDHLSGILIIDFVVHGHGPLSSWAAHAVIGDRVQVSDPRSEFKISSDSNWALLAGDETALPAIGALLDDCSYRGNMSIYIEVSDDAEKQCLKLKNNCSINWLIRCASDTPGSLLEDALRLHSWSAAKGQVWVACESHAIKRIRNYLIEVLKMPKSMMNLSGYWKLGVADEREELSDY